MDESDIIRTAKPVTLDKDMWLDKKSGRTGVSGSDFNHNRYREVGFPSQKRWSLCWECYWLLHI